MAGHRLGHAQQQRKQKSGECREGYRKDVQAVAEGLNGATREPEMRSNYGHLTGYCPSCTKTSRIPYKDGFSIGHPEIALKFRHPDLLTTIVR